MNAEPSPVYLTLDEVATACRVSRETVRKWITTGRLPAYRISRKCTRVAVDDLAAVMRPVPVDVVA